MSGIIADGLSSYLAKLAADEDAAIRNLEKALAAAVTEDAKIVLRTQMELVRNDFARRRRAAPHSLF